MSTNKRIESLNFEVKKLKEHIHFIKTVSVFRIIAEVNPHLADVKELIDITPEPQRKTMLKWINYIMKKKKTKEEIRLEAITLAIKYSPTLTLSALEKRIEFIEDRLIGEVKAKEEEEE